MSDCLLWRAVCENDTETVRLLLEQGTDPNNPLYWSDDWMNQMYDKWLVRPPPVHLACSNGNLLILQLLIQGGADVSIGGGVCNMTPLHWACGNGHKDLVDFLVSMMGCKVDVRDNNIMTPLHLACWKGHIAVVQYLVEEYNCDVEAMDLYYRTPFQLASEGGHKCIIQYLAEKKKCNINVRDKSNSTPLHSACWNGHTEVVQYLTEELKCDTDVKDHDNNTPLHHACAKGYTAIVKYLVEEHNCDADGVQNKQGYTAFQLATKYSTSFFSSDTLKKTCTEIVTFLTSRQQPSTLQPPDGPLADFTIPSITLMFVRHPLDVSVKPGIDVEFSVETIPTAASYTWHFQDKPITSKMTDYNGCTTKCLLIQSCVSKHKGVYKCLATADSGDVISSEEATLTLNGERISKEESKLLGEILVKANLNLEAYGIDINLLTDGKLDLTYEEMQYLLKDNPATYIQNLSESLKEQIVTRLEEEKLYKEAMENDQQISISYTKILALGPGQVGKSTFLYRLMGRMKGNIQTSDPLTRPQSSTGIAEMHEACLTYRSRTCALLPDTDNWQVFDESCDLQVQLDGLMSLLLEQMANKPDYQPHLSDCSGKLDSSANLRTDEKVQTEFNDYEKVESESKNIMVVEQMSLKPSNNDPDDIPLETGNLSAAATYLSPQISNIDKVIEEFEKVRGDCKLLPNRIKFRMLFNIADIGGQPAFLEMLPSLTIGPALYLVFMKLIHGLRTRYPVSFKCKDGRGSKLCKNYTYTSEEVIFTALSSIACFGNSDEEVERYVINPGNKDQTRSYALLIGTFSDKVKDKETLENIDSQLKKELEETDFFSDGLIHSKSFLRVNNDSAEESEIQSQRKLLEDILENKFHTYNIPTRWLIFSICLKLLSRRERKYEISFEDCVKLGGRLGMERKMVKVALQFLHKYIGLVMYFPTNSYLQNIVICNPQIVFSSISELIFDIYDPRNMYITEAQHDYFVRTGCFSPQDIKETKKKGVTENLLSVYTLVRLLLHLNIIAEVSLNINKEAAEEKDENMTGQKKYYFLPAVLQTAESSLLERQVTEDQLPEPLCLRFQTGYLPLGFVCALSAKLIANQIFKLIPFQDENKQITFKNMMKFRFNGKFDMVMISGPKYCEFRVSRWSGNTEYWANECCPLIKTKICEAADEVIKTLKYNSLYKRPNDATYELAFRCPMHKNAQVIGHEPLARLLYDCTKNSSKILHPIEIQCVHTSCASVCELSPEMKMWFGKGIPTNPPKIAREPSIKGDQIKIQAVGSNPLLFQWFKDESEITDDANFKGATTSELSIFGCSEQVTGIYKCRVVNVYGKSLSKEILYDPFAKELKQRGLEEEEVHKLLDNGIKSLEDLKSLTEEDVREIDFKIGERKRVMRAVSSLKLSGATAAERMVPHDSTTNMLGVLRSLLWDTRSKWKHLGIDLNIPNGTLDAIKSKYSSDVDMYFTEMLEIWLQRNPKLTDLLDSLRGPIVSRIDLAEKLERKVNTGEIEWTLYYSY